MAGAGSVKDAGSVTVLKRTEKAIYPATVLTQATKGVSGTAETGNSSAPPWPTATTAPSPSASPGKAYAISSPFQGGGSVYVISSDPTIDPRSWKPGAGSIPGTGFRFGQSVA